MALHVSGVDAAGQLDRSAIGSVIYLHVDNAHRFVFFLFGFRCASHTMQCQVPWFNQQFDRLSGDTRYQINADLQPTGKVIDIDRAILRILYRVVSEIPVPDLRDHLILQRGSVCLVQQSSSWPVPMRGAL